MPLTDLMAKQAKPEEKTWTMSDGRGLMLEIRPDGKKYWIVRYRANGKEKCTSLGRYPDVTLEDAREKHMEIRKTLASGLTLEQAARQAETFAQVASSS